MGTEQNNINIEHGGKVIGRDDNSVNVFFSPGTQNKLSNLFSALKDKFEKQEQTDIICEELIYYKTERDTIGLQQKLIDGNLDYLYDDASSLKEIYAKKLYKYQFYEPAQQIYVYILSIICSKFRYLIYPLLRKKVDQETIFSIISKEIVDPILHIIQEYGCNDIMGLTANDIDGMIYFLTGRCHIKWKL